MIKLPEPACTVSPYEVNHIFWEAGHEQAGCGSSLFTEAQMLQFRRDALDEAAKLAKPRNKRPCDCERCDCGNKDDAQRVAEWDAENSVATAIRKLKDAT
jgi:hypothetical protein